MANSLWYVETNARACDICLNRADLSRTATCVLLGSDASDRAVDPTAERVNYRKPGFVAKFLELQKVMWTTNAGLTDRHAYDSRPWSWPILRRGIKCVRTNGRSSDRSQLLGPRSPPGLPDRQPCDLDPVDAVRPRLRRRSRSIVPAA